MKPEKYTKLVLTKVVSESSSYGELARRLGIVHGGSRDWVKKKIAKFGIDTSHFTVMGRGWSKGVLLVNRRRTPQELFVVLPQGSNRPKGYQLRFAMVQAGVIEQCALCPVSSEWNGKKLVLVVDHKNGNWLDNRFGNLRLLCPNCDSQTDTYKSKNRGSTNNGV